MLFNLDLGCNFATFHTRSAATTLTFALQALLARHESHMAEAEEERLRMTATIDQLESDKRELEVSNAMIITENRELLDQLEDINNQVVESNSHIDSLTATLASTRQELSRLNVLARRAAQLETQLTNIELEYAELQTKFSNAQEENRTTMQRWRRAEGTINYLQEQVDKIEREAKEERERHVEVLDRFERRRTVERELEAAASRLKGAAAAKSLRPSNQQGSNVISLFVRDILQDNANLQLGVVELREMLSGSNAEVESLREQLLLHQPLERKTSTLRAELGETSSVEEPPFEPVPELHVHHHYHEPKVAVKRIKKRKTIVANKHYIPSGITTPRQQRVKDWRASTSSAATILSQTSATLPPNRWSMQSGASFAPSSIPSSPHRAESLFDSLDSALDSRPSTPESSILGSSPSAQFKNNEHIATILPHPAGYRSTSTPGPSQSSGRVPITGANMAGLEELGNSGQGLADSSRGTILEEHELNEEKALSESSVKSFPTMRHRRVASCESLRSLTSISMPLKTQLSQDFNNIGRGLNSILYSPTTASIPMEAMVTHATVAAEDVRSPITSTHGGETMARSLLYRARTASNDQLSAKKPSGGWMFGKWGKTPLPSPVTTSGMPQSPIEAALRSPGVNQTGFIRGLAPPKRTPSNVQPANIDRSALQEALAEQVN